MTEGHEWLRRTLNVSVNVGWQIDPFGHSTSSASVLAACGIRAQVINRIHFATKRRWQQEKRLEFEWEVAPDHSLLTHVLYDSYSWPVGFDLEVQHIPAGAHVPLYKRTIEAMVSEQCTENH
eukprot:6198445-Pleurochrysis_carterae.AAC.3